jgi:Arc/MetJ family transcription regulator
MKLHKSTEFMMRYRIHGWMHWLIACSAFACASDVSNPPDSDSSSRQTKTIHYEGRSVQAIIDKPKGTSFDVLMVFHGTVQGQANQDVLILEAAETTRSAFRNVLDRQDVMIVSVAYPQANLLFGDNLVYAETALKWLKNRAEAELGVDVKRIFLGGHSQGGYLVTRLNMARCSTACKLEPNSISSSTTGDGDVCIKFDISCICGVSFRMRTTIDIPQDLVDKAIELTDAKTKTEVIKLALQELIRRESMKKLLAYRGKVDLDINLDELRERG